MVEIKVKDIIMYEVKKHTDPDTDLADLLSTLRERLISTPRVIMYCNVLMMLAHIFVMSLVVLGFVSFNTVFLKLMRKELANSEVKRLLYTTAKKTQYTDVFLNYISKARLLGVFE